MSRLRTRSAWLLVVPFLLLAEPAVIPLSVGSVLAVIGLGIRAWAAGTVWKDGELAVTGPYARIRHPLYAGSLVAGLGISASGGHWLWPLLFVTYFVLVYGPVIRAEERRLDRLFGDAYRAYRARVPALVPGLRSWCHSSRSSAGQAGSRVRSNPKATQGTVPQPPVSPTAGGRSGFTLARYAQNREWEALLGTIAILGLLTLKL